MFQPPQQVTNGSLHPKKPRPASQTGTRSQAGSPAHEPRLTPWKAQGRPGLPLAGVGGPAGPTSDFDSAPARRPQGPRGCSEPCGWVTLLGLLPSSLQPLGLFLPSPGQPGSVLLAETTLLAARQHTHGRGAIRETDSHHDAFGAQRGLRGHQEARGAHGRNTPAEPTRTPPSRAPSHQAQPSPGQPGASQSTPGNSRDHLSAKACCPRCTQLLANVGNHRQPAPGRH